MGCSQSITLSFGTEAVRQKEKRTASSSNVGISIDMRVHKKEKNLVFTDVSTAPMEEAESKITADIEQDSLHTMSSKACFGAGSYWGTEKFIYDEFGKNSFGGKIFNGEIGFMGPPGAPSNPTYMDVCKGKTGHIEVYDFEFTGGASYYEALVRYFFQIHDCTTMCRQGNDVGKQYSSVIYCYDQQQMRIAKKVKAEFQALLDAGALPKNSYENAKVVTDIKRSTDFYPGPYEHRNYLLRNPAGYCNLSLKFTEWPTISRQQNIL